MLPLRIARRFIWRSRVQSILIVTGIALGIGTQLFVGSLIASLQASLLESTVGSSAHVVLTAPDAGGRLADSQLIERLVADPQINAVVPGYELSALVDPGDGALEPLVLKAAELGALDTIYGLSGRVVDGRARLSGDDVLIGAEFAAANAIGPGDELRLTLGAGIERTVTVSGVFDLGVAAVNERNGFIAPDLAREALAVPAGEVDLIELQVRDVFDSGAIAAGYERSHEVAATDWQEQNAQLLAGLRSQSISSIMIQVFVIVAVALGIASTLAISAVQKTRQIGILKALGLTDGSSGAIFLVQAGLLGTAGSLVGVALGGGLIAAFDAAASSSAGLFPVSVDPGFALVSLAIGIGVSLLSAVIPVRATAGLDPIEVIQNG